MSNLTLEEHAKSLERDASLFDGGFDTESDSVTLLAGAAALRFQERHRWRRKDQEDPPKSGEYLVAHPLLGGHYYIQKAEWNDQEAKFGVSGPISHWKYIDPPTEED